MIARRSPTIWEEMIYQINYTSKLLCYMADMYFRDVFAAA